MTENKQVIEDTQSIQHEQNSENTQNIDKNVETFIDELEEYQHANKFEKYINTEFKEAAKEFIYATGVYSSNFSLEKKIEKINVQLEQCREEAILEFLAAYGVDKKEEVDGRIDTLFVYLNLREMIEDFNSSLSKVDDEEKVVDILNKLNAPFYELVTTILPKALTLSNSSTEEKMIACSKLIVENNKLKYTTDKNEAESWVIDNSDGLNTKLQAVEWNGSTYYSLVDDNGKIRKHKNFKKVVLEDILGE